MIRVFECPFRNDCHRDKIVGWYGTEAIEVVIPVKCKAPLLMNRKTGDTICMIEIEEDKKDNWIDAVKDIGRKRSQG